ncbi:hypothetical protein IW492_05815 [Enterococcus sp. BWB1-3]|uniref:hypothetical protein n=1 Tax=Enterococcus sp. BWB1-3 TaxID=2787713 RepID=UPI001920AC17|nr:hypothetical protein [Enterococcus sp. BWB1-3]MBL1228748.1 hypothetical protein [Enterococcus sp. BWB1-3]
MDIITDHLQDGRLPVVQFGEGNLLPFFTKDSSGYSMTIFKVDVKRPFQVATPEEQDILLADGKPLVVFDFSNTPAGLNGLTVLNEWVTELEEEAKGE